MLNFMHAGLCIKADVRPKKLMNRLMQSDKISYVSHWTRMRDGLYFEIYMNGCSNTEQEIFARLAAMRAVRNGSGQPAYGTEYQISLMGASIWESDGQAF